MSVSTQLKLPRAHTLESIQALPRNPLRGTPTECRAAATALLALDVLEKNPEDSAVRQRVETVLLSPEPACGEKVGGGQYCSLRTALFSAWLLCRPAPSTLPSQVLRWITLAGLRGFIRDPPNWRLSDLMLALETLCVRYDDLAASLWRNTPEAGVRAFCDNNAPFGIYLNFLWGQCSKFAQMHQHSDVASRMDTNTFTVPYASDGGHAVSLSPNAVAKMCEVWRFVESERRTAFSARALRKIHPHDAKADEALFLRVFAAERDQLRVDTFREKLRLGLVERYLFPGDNQLWAEENNGKKPEPDLVMGALCPLAMPGFLQQVASAWSFEQITKCPAMRDCLYAMMADTAFLAKFHVRWTTLFLQPHPLAAKTHKLKIPGVQRLCGNFIVVVNRKAVTPPMPLASCFKAWAQMLDAMGGHAYGSDFTPITRLFAR